MAQSCTCNVSSFWRRCQRPIVPDIEFSFCHRITRFFFYSSLASLVCEEFVFIILFCYHRDHIKFFFSVVSFMVCMGSIQNTFNYVNNNHVDSYPNTYNPEWTDHPKVFYNNHSQYFEEPPNSQLSNLEMLMGNFIAFKLALTWNLRWRVLW